MRPALLLVLASVLVVLAWGWVGRPVDPQPGVRVDRFDCLSFAPFRPGQSPLTDTFPTAAEVDQDMALLAGRTRAVRTYAALEGRYDAAEVAQRHGLKLWQGIWLGGDRAKNQAEIAHGIEMARRYPGTVDRVIVGNEVLLRRDLPPAELMADIDTVRRQVRQPVAYADVWDFWQQFPEVARHVDIVLIHLLPYWEDTPTGIDRAVAYVGQVYDRMAALFPGKRIGIGETGWPSRGRQRRDAVPGRLEEARFVRQFIALSQSRHFDYNLIEAFDQEWKYEHEGVVGANWGLLTADRREKIPLAGALSAFPAWPRAAAASVLFGWLLVGFGGLARPEVTRGRVVLAGMALGVALGFAQAMTDGVMYDLHARIAGVANLAGQAVLAVLAMARLGAPLVGRSGAETTAAVRALLLRGAVPREAGAALEDLWFVFLWAAAVDQLLLVFDPRYRDFPLANYAVPLVVGVGWLARGAGRPAWGREEWLVGGALAVGAVASAVQEGWLNGESLVWNAAALGLVGCARARYINCSGG